MHQRKENPPRVREKTHPSDQKTLMIQNRTYPYIPEKFKNEIQKFWKVPYIWGGASPKGTDCSGLIVALFKGAYGLSLPHSTKGLYQLGEKIALQELTFGDLVFFSDDKSGNPTHVGLYISRKIFIHASIREGVSTARLDKPPYNDMYIGARRLNLKVNPK